MITLFDLSAEFWRNYYADCNADQAFALTLDRIHEYARYNERLAILCDSPRCVRYEWAPDYKGNRGPKPEGGADALAAVKEQAALNGLPVVECDGYEADDLMATLVRQAWPEDVQLIVQDKDLYQLICENVWLVSRGRIIDEAACVAKFGVKPSQIRDYLALVGDAADNVKGCPGIGKGKAATILNRFGSLHSALKADDADLLSLPGISTKVLASLRSWDPTLAVKLVSLLDDAPVSLEKLWPRAA